MLGHKKKKKKKLLPSACGDCGDKSATSGVSAQKIPASVSAAQRARGENDQDPPSHAERHTI